MERLSDETILAELAQAGAILHGHFQLTSGRHSDTYVQCARILEDPGLTTRLAEAMVGLVEERVGTRAIDIVAAPAIGGIIVGFAVAQALEVKFIFSERQDGAMTFRRGFEVPEGARVLVVEDVVTTGGSVAEVVELVHASGGSVPAVISIIDRGGSKAFDVDYVPLLRLEVESWEPRDCVLCESRIPLYSPGSRRLSG